MSDESPGIDAGFLRSFRALIDRALTIPAESASELSGVGKRLSDFLGVDVRALPVVSETFPPHRLVDVDIALAELSGDAEANLFGVTGGQQRYHSGASELMASAFVRFQVGPVDFTSRATGPDSERQVVAFGVRQFLFDGSPVAVIQRAPKPEYGQQDAVLELIAEHAATSAALLSRIRSLMIDRSVLRGQVLSFVGTEYGNDAGATFLRRPTVSAEDVVLGEGVLERIRQHVVGIGDFREQIRAAGQHLKRGVLLYGPPGTGKTLTVRHLLAATPDVTAVLLQGTSIRFIGAAAEIARTLQPSIVVLEDVDLVASDRDFHNGPQPLLFEVLDALDGLDGDADVAFIMTTNRVDALERALVQRPGRVDLAVEIPLPDLESRRRIFRRYASGLSFSDEALDAAAARADGTTGSFAKELIRRAVLSSAQRSTPVTDDDLRVALDALLDSAESLTRRLLGEGDAGGAATRHR